MLQCNNAFKNIQKLRFHNLGMLAEHC